ncbi:MAG: GNAT family N-acetyltransferase [Ferruginibacter sp.]
MTFRESIPADIPQIQFVRNSVQENMLSDPALVSDKDCEEYMTTRGKAWVCEVRGIIVGFAYVDLKENNVWALFIHPEHAGKGIGKRLHKTMLDWYFSVTNKTLWLRTAPSTRAEEFYRRQGWKESGMHGKEIKFEMTSDAWKGLNRNP